MRRRIKLKFIIELDIIKARAVSDGRAADLGDAAGAEELGVNTSESFQFSISNN